MADNSWLIVDALEKTAPELARQINARNSWQPAIAKRGKRIKKYRRYERGDHDAKMQTETRRLLRLTDDGDGLNDLNINYCKVVVDKMAGRIEVASVTSTDDTANEWITDTLNRNRFQSLQSTWYRGAIRDGDSFVVVDPETMRWVTEPAYDGFSGMVAIRAGIDSKPIWACKLWSIADTEDIAGDENTSAKMKLIVYTPNEISYWEGQEGSASVTPDNIDAPAGIQAGNSVLFPLDRLPIEIFTNQMDNYTAYGESELRSAIPINNDINSIEQDKIVASAYAAYKLGYSIGLEIDPDAIMPGAILNLVLRDENENLITDPTDGQLSLLKAVSVGQFDATDIGQYTSQIEKAAQQLSQVTQTPIYGITTQGNLSGEALKQLEIGLLGKVERFQNQNTDAIIGLIELTALMQNKIDNDLGNAPIVENVNVVWQGAEIINVNERITALANLIEKTPQFTELYMKRIGALLGMSQADIQEELDKAAESQGRFFDTLTGAGGGVPVVQSNSVGEEVAPENIASKEGLNGAQIKAAVEILQGVSDKTVAPDVVVELLVSLGIAEEKAVSMVNAQKTIGKVDDLDTFTNIAQDDNPLVS